MKINFSKQNKVDKEGNCWVVKIGSAINLIWFGCSRNIVEVQCRIYLCGEYLLALADVRHFLHLNSTPQSCHFTKICKMSVCFREMGRLTTNSILMIVPQHHLYWNRWNITVLDITLYQFFSLIFVYLPWLNLYLPSEDLQRSVSHLWCGSVNNIFNVLNIKNVVKMCLTSSVLEHFCTAGAASQYWE